LDERRWFFKSSRRTINYLEALFTLLPNIYRPTILVFTNYLTFPKTKKGEKNGKD